MISFIDFGSWFLLESDGSIKIWMWLSPILVFYTNTIVDVIQYTAWGHTLQSVKFLCHRDVNDQLRRRGQAVFNRALARTPEQRVRVSKSPHHPKAVLTPVL
jgi:hypothetical protein